MLLHSSTNRYQHLTNFADWNFPIQKVSWIDEGFATFVWGQAPKMTGTCPRSPRGSPAARWAGTSASLWGGYNTIKKLTSCLHPHRDLGSWASCPLPVLSPQQLAEMSRHWEHAENPWRATKERFVVATSRCTPKPARGCEETSEDVFLPVVHVIEIFVSYQWWRARVKF